MNTYVNLFGLTKLALALTLATTLHAAPASPPNIVYILADDLGYGDVKYLNSEGKIATPNMDRLGREGMAFTDAHASSAVCTPSRYSILTGRYCWRTQLQTGVIEGNSKPLIKAGQLTVASLLKQHGYNTACIGKWHLGMNIPKDGGHVINDGPTTCGFDYYYGIAASLDMPPFAFIENDHFTEVPSVTKKWIRSGPAAPSFEAVDALPTLTRKAAAYIDAQKNAKTPFFLYLALPSPHTPIVPSPEWKGRSGISDYADYVMETDWAVGEVLDALERNGVAQNTVVYFASDNGCSPAANFRQLAKFGHNPSYIFRGTKSDIWDGGHRIPLIVRWPGKIKTGATSGQTVCLGDFMATCAEMLGVKLPGDAGQDSVSILPALFGKATKPLRDFIVYHSINGRFGIQQGNWKLELCAGSGGWSNPNESQADKRGLPSVQLYDMSNDVSEQKNVSSEHPEIVSQLTHLLEKCVADGRSTPGSPEKNDVNVDIWKKKKAIAN